MSYLLGRTERPIASFIILLAGSAVLFACAPGSEPVDEGGATILPSTQPNFAAPIGFAVGSQPNAIVSADFNADGKLDLAAANGAGNTVSVLLNTTVAGAAAPTFRAQLQFPTGTVPYGLAAGDMNGDGKVDLVVANSGAGTVSVLVNTMVSGATTPTFAPQVSFVAGGPVAAIAVGDLNGDGKVDVAVANGVNGTVSVLLNATVAGGPVTFIPPVSFPAGFGVVSLALGDFNGDGKLDVVAVNLSASAGAVAILLNTMANGATTPSLSSFTQLPVGFSPSGLALGDLNGDGKLDVLTFSPAAASGISVRLNTTVAGSITPTTVAGDSILAESYPESMVLMDRNGDGTLDLFVASFGGGSSGVGVTDNFTTGGATTWRLDGPHGFPAGNQLADLCTSVMAVGDLNGDGRLDVAVTDFSTNRVKVLVGIPNTL